MAESVVVLLLGVYLLVRTRSQKVQDITGIVLVILAIVGISLTRITGIVQ